MSSMPFITDILTIVWWKKNVRKKSFRLKKQLKPLLEKIVFNIYKTCGLYNHYIIFYPKHDNSFMLFVWWFRFVAGSFNANNTLPSFQQTKIHIAHTNKHKLKQRPFFIHARSAP